jgi:hypothetical protein
MSLIAIILFILVLFGIAPASEPAVQNAPVTPPATVSASPEPAWTQVDIDGIQGVIVDTSAVGGFGLPTPYWTPTLADVTAAESAIAESEGALDHLRQYAGFTEDGDRKILVNGFCSAEANWQAEIVFVLDGGECYFSAVYNVDTSELENFAFNGDA